MTAPDGLEGESPREACANMSMVFRNEAAILREYGLNAMGDLPLRFEAWASRLERACRTLDAEKRGTE